MSFPQSFTDQDILDLASGDIEIGYRKRVLNPQLDPTFRYITLYPKVNSTETPRLESITLEPGELTIFSIQKDEVSSLATTRRFFWIDPDSQMRSVNFRNIRDVGLMAGWGDPAYPKDYKHYFVNGVLHEGVPPADICLRDCDPKFSNPFIYLIDTTDHRHVIKLVEKFPIYSTIDLLRSASEGVSEARIIKNQQKLRKSAGGWIYKIRKDSNRIGR